MSKKTLYSNEHYLCLQAVRGDASGEPGQVTESTGEQWMTWIQYALKRKYGEYGIERPFTILFTEADKCWIRVPHPFYQVFWSAVSNCVIPSTVGSVALHMQAQSGFLTGVLGPTRHQVFE
jgi:hypothetical protein